MNKEENLIFGGLEKWSKIDKNWVKNFPQILKIGVFWDPTFFKCLKIERKFS